MNCLGTFFHRWVNSKQYRKMVYFSDYKRKLENSFLTNNISQKRKLSIFYWGLRTIDKWTAFFSKLQWEIESAVLRQNSQFFTSMLRLSLVPPKFDSLKLLFWENFYCFFSKEEKFGKHLQLKIIMPDLHIFRIFWIF